MKNKEKHDTTAEQASAPQSAPEQSPDALKAAEYYEQMLRLKADFDNLRKRAAKEKPELIAWGRMDVMLKLLSLYDVLLQARTQMDRIMSEDKAACSGPTQALCKGLEMIFTEFTRFFEGEGIRPIDALGKPYDPMSHEVLSMVDGEDGIVVSEAQRGFTCGGKVLRPAKVCVGRKKAAQQENDNSGKTE